MKKQGPGLVSFILGKHEREKMEKETKHERAKTRKMRKETERQKKTNKT